VHAAVDQEREVRVPLREHAHDAHLAAEARGLLAGPRGVDRAPGPAAQQGLDGDLPVRGVRGGLQVLGPVHLAHVPAPDDACDAETSADCPQPHLPLPIHPFCTRWMRPARERIPSRLKRIMQSVYVVNASTVLLVRSTYVSAG